MPTGIHTDSFLTSTDSLRERRAANGGAHRAASVTGPYAGQPAADPVGLKGELRRSSSDPANPATDRAGATHQGRPACTTSRPQAMPIVHLTPGPRLRRVQRLEQDKVILGYRAVVDLPARCSEGQLGRSE